MNIYVRNGLSALAAAIIGGGGVAVASMTENGAITRAGIAIAVITGLMAAAKDIQAALMKTKP